MPAGALEIGLIGRLHGHRSWEPENRLVDVDLDDFDRPWRIDGDRAQRSIASGLRSPRA